jgi:chromosomal replication initiation ATPase DnaA
MVEAADMPGMPPEALRGNMLIENIERLGDARALLHAFNYARENGSQLLLTSGVPPHSLPFTLPDLMSRLLALPAAHIDQPDDDLLAAAMRKQFADRQMKVDEEVVAYVLPRIERSLGEVARVVKWLDGCALAEHKDITVRFVRRMLSIPSPLES